MKRGIGVYSTVIASEAKQSILSNFVVGFDCFASLAMTTIGKSSARGPWGDGWKPRALLKEEVGEASSFQPTSSE